MNVSRNSSYLGTLRARLGYILGDKLLIAGSGGLAYGGVDSNTQLNQRYVTPGDALETSWTSTGKYSRTLTGWTAGALCEYLFYKNWSIKLEYLYYDLGSITYSDTNLADLITVPNTPQDFFTNTMSTSTQFNGNILRFGINYHFL